MKIICISKDGIRPATAGKGPYYRMVADNQFHYHVFTHGERGRGRWRVELPLATRDFPVSEPVSPDQDFTLVPLYKQDSGGQPRYILSRGQDDGTYLVLLSLSPGFRGGGSYSVDGECKVIAEGREAQGDAGRMGSCPCPLIHVTGPCKLRWHRTGRLYGSAADWVAKYNGTEWTVLTADQADVLEAMASV